MLVRNNHTMTLLVAGLPIAPGREGEVADEAWREWRSRTRENREIAAKYLSVRPGVDPPEGGGWEPSRPSGVEGDDPDG